MNIASSLERARVQFPDKEAIVFEERRITYTGLDEAASRVANLLRELGVGRGDRVALFLPNIPEFAFSYFGVQKLGAVAVSLNVMLKPAEVRFILEDSRPKVLVTTAELRANVPEDELDPELRILVAEGEAEPAASLQHLMKRASARAAAAEMESDDPAAILYTSGTTGFPKGATLSHGNVISNLWATNHHTGMGTDDRLHLFLPLFHCFGQNFIMSSGINAGATLVLERRFALDTGLDTLRRERVTMFFAVPTLFIRLLNEGITAADLASTRYHFSAAAPLPVEIASAWRERFERTIWEGYGLTETSPFASYNHDLRYKLGSIGEPIENVEMKVVDDDGAEVEPGEWGEIVIRGPNVMLGYWDRAEDTEQAIRHGWFHSGDIGTVDEEGYFAICDRKKDMIITSGFNVYPAEVENTLYAHPAVAEAAVFGAADAERGEVVKAAVVPRGGKELHGQELIDFCRERMAAYKAPRVVELVSEIPKSATGKVLKRVLRDAD